MKKAILFHALSDLRRAYENNVFAHQYRDEINEQWMNMDVCLLVNKRDRHYHLKNKYIIKCIEKIKKYKLNIKYGTLNGVTYFEYD